MIIPICTKRRPKQVSGKVIPHKIPKVSDKDLEILNWGNDIPKDAPKPYSLNDDDFDDDLPSPNNVAAWSYLQRQKQTQKSLAQRLLDSGSGPIQPTRQPSPEILREPTDAELKDLQKFLNVENGYDDSVRTGVHRLDEYLNSMVKNDEIVPACVRTIASIIVGIEWEVLQNYENEDMGTPWDAEEFNLCSDLVATMGWEDDLEQVVSNDPLWGPFVENWGELCYLYANGKDDELDALISQCQNYADNDMLWNNNDYDTDVINDNEDFDDPQLPPHLL